MNKRIIRGTTSAGVKSFENALKNYIDSTRSITLKIKNLHEEVGKSWNDPQYVKITESINEFEQRMSANLDKLETLSGYVQQKRRFLEEKGV